MSKVIFVREVLAIYKCIC